METFGFFSSSFFFDFFKAQFTVFFLQKIKKTTMLKKKFVQEYSFSSRDVQPPFSLNMSDVCCDGNKIGSVTAIEKISNKRGTIYTATFSEPIEIKKNQIYYNNKKFANIFGEIKSMNYGENVSDFFDHEKYENTKHGHFRILPVIEKKEPQSATQLLLNKINDKLEDWNFDELFDLYEKIRKMK